MEQIALFFAALADPLRLRCLALISGYGEICVCQLTHALEAPQPKVSKHLAILRAANLIEQRRAAQWVLYRLADLPAWAETALQGAIAGVGDDPLHRADLLRIATAPEGPSAQVLQSLNMNVKETMLWPQ